VPPCKREDEKVKTSSIYKTWLRGSGRLPQGGESPLPLPRGIDECCGRHWRGHCLAPSRPSGACRHLRDARRLSRRLPGGGRSLTRPGAVSSAASTAVGEGGEGSHLSGEARPPSLSSSSSPDDEYSEVVGEESPSCSRSRHSSLLCSRRSRRRFPFSFLCAARSCSHRCAARMRARARGVGGSDRAAFTAMNCRG
jgi:hypothetical protein